MGRIPEYQRGQLASEYVGGAQLDNSGALATAALGDALQPILKNEMAKKEADQEFHYEQQAGAAIMDASLLKQRLFADVQKRYVDNPENMLPAFREESSKQNAEILKSFSNSKVHRMVGNGLLQLDKSMLPTVSASAMAQRENITRTVFQTASETLVNACSSAETLGDFQANIHAAYNMYHPDLTEVSAEAIRRVGLSPETRDKMYQDTIDRSAAAFLAKAVVDDPVSAAKLIKSKAFNSLTDATGAPVPIHVETKDKYLKLAKDYIPVMQKRRDLDTVINATGDDFKFAQEFWAGEKNLNDVIVRNEVMSRDKTIPKSTHDFNSALQRVALRSVNDSDTVDELTMGRIYAKYSALTDKMNRKKKSNKPKAIDRDPAAFTTEVAELYTEVLNARADGKMPSKEAQNMISKLIGPLYTAIAANTGTSRDEHNEAYKDLMQMLKSDTSLPADEKEYAKAKVFTVYMKKVVDAEAAGGVVDRKISKQLARDAYTDMIKTYYPELRASVSDEAPNGVAGKDGVMIAHTNPVKTVVDTSVRRTRPKKGDRKMINGKLHIAGDSGWVEQ